MASVTNTSSTKSAAETFAAINGNSGTKNTSASAVADMEDRFLTLLMTQIKNQDPLNPLDNAQVTSQLSQLNMVSGIEKLNATLGQLLNGYNEALGMQAAGIIGKNVMVAGNALPLASGKAFGGALLDSKADNVLLTIKNAAGQVVRTENLGAQDAGTFYFSWDGKDSSGNALADGKYSFTINAALGGEKVGSTNMQIGTVSAVIRSNNGFLLDMGSLGEVAFSDVQQIL